MARKRRTDNRGRVLRVGESQNKQGRYIYKWTDAAGKRNTVYAVTLQELRGKEQQIQKDIADGIDSRGGDLTLNQLFNVFMESKSNIRESTRINYTIHWNANIKTSLLSDMKIAQIKQYHIKKWIADLRSKGAKASSVKRYETLLSMVLQFAVKNDLIRKNPCADCGREIKSEPTGKISLTIKQQQMLLEFIEDDDTWCVHYPLILFLLSTGLRISDDDDKIRLNQRKPSKYKGLRRFGPEKNLQRINRFMKERPIFYKNLIQMKENFRFYLRCFYCITKVVILQFNSENRTELARNG